MMRSIVFISCLLVFITPIRSITLQQQPLFKTQSDAEQSPAEVRTEVSQTDITNNFNRPAFDAAMIESINSGTNTWTAGVNQHFVDQELEFVKTLCGVHGMGEPNIDTTTEFRPHHHYTTLSALPAQYDARTAHPNCPSISEIRDQGACGSCWSIAAVEAMTDRFCIASEGSEQPYLSAIHMVTCCGAHICGDCAGGLLAPAWNYWKENGIVTGEGYGAGGCYPYPFQPCAHHVEGTDLPKCSGLALGGLNTTPQCANACKSNFGTSFTEDRNFGDAVYRVPKDQEQIKAEIYRHGPVEAAYLVYADFVTYKSGVYQHVTGEVLGGHAIKLLGWGTENGVDYWLAANSWNNDWGDNGFFKIRRGTNECGIEEMVYAGTPKLKESSTPTRSRTTPPAPAV